MGESAVNQLSDLNISNSLDELPQDIIDQVVLDLELDDVLNLSLLNKKFHEIILSSPTIQSHLFQLYYNDSLLSYTWNQTHPNWLEISKKRKNARLYSWGSLNGGRLGYSPAYIHNSNLDSNLSRMGFNQGIFNPLKIPNFEKSIKLISGGGFSFQILTSDGEIYSTGSSWHYGHNSGVGPNGQDYNELIELARAQEREQQQQQESQQEQDRLPNGTVRIPLIGRRGGCRLPPLPGRVRLPAIIGNPGRRIHAPGYNLPSGRNESNEIKKINVIGDAVKFQAIHSGRAHFLGLTNNNKVYSFDTHEFGIPLQFNIENKVKKIKAGWDYNLIEFYNKGLGYWRKREAISKDSKESEVEVKMITSKEVIDFIGLENYIIYIDLNSKIWRYDFSNSIKVELVEFQKSFLKLNETAIEPKSIKISGFFKTFVIFSNIDICLFGNCLNINEVQIIPELNSVGCVNIEIGDYHLLALTSSGKLLSWGLESNKCGCLGLGNEETVIRRGGNREGGSLRIVKPTEIETVKNCVGIASGGWQSCAIINE